MFNRHECLTGMFTQLYKFKYKTMHIYVTEYLRTNPMKENRPSIPIQVTDFSVLLKVLCIILVLFFLKGNSQ